MPGDCLFLKSTHEIVGFGRRAGRCAHGETPAPCARHGMGETLIGCKNGEILVMRTCLGATAGGVWDLNRWRWVRDCRGGVADPSRFSPDKPNAVI